MISKEAYEFFGKWGAQGKVDLLDEMNNLTMLTASRCLLGREIREEPQVREEFAKLYHDLEGGINSIAYFFPNAPIPSLRKRDYARIAISKLFSKIIKQRRQMTEEERPDDMLANLMECQYKDGQLLSDDHIAGMLIGILFAGQHTSGISSTWTGLFLLNHPKFLKEALEEQEEIRKEFGEEITFDSLKRSVFLENCVREALRMYPPLIILMRKVKVPLKYENYDIPVGDLLAISTAFSMRLSEVYTNPDTYDPHRFDRGEHNKPYAYLAFGGGRHGCPGENFGVMQIKTIWTVLLRNFDFDTPALPQPDYTNMVIGPTQPCMLSFRRKPGVSL